MLEVVKKAASVGVTVEWIDPTNFNKELADKTKDGFIEGTIVLKKGSITKNIDVNLTIDQLPLDSYTGEEANPQLKSKTDAEIVLEMQTITGENVEYTIVEKGKQPTETSVWQTSTTFSGLDSNKEYEIFARVQEKAGDHFAGKVQSLVVKTDKSDADLLAEAKAAIEKAFSKLTITNDTSQEFLMNTAKNAVTNGVSIDWDSSVNFVKNIATSRNPGSITGQIELSIHGKTTQLPLNFSIAQLPKTDMDYVEDAESHLNAILANLVATNDMTQEDILQILQNQMIGGVRIEWANPSNYNKTLANENSDGSVLGDFVLKKGNASKRISNIALKINQLSNNIEYEYTAGMGGNWTSGSSDNLSFKVNGDLNKFVCVRLNGKVLDAKYYILKSGSTIITLVPELLKTLIPGTYDLQCIYTDGYANTEFVIKAPTKDEVNSPETGDATNKSQFLFLLTMSGCVLLSTLRKRKNVLE